MKTPLVSLNVFECVVRLAVSLFLCMLGGNYEDPIG